MRKLVPVPLLSSPRPPRPNIRGMPIISRRPTDHSAHQAWPPTIRVDIQACPMVGALGPYPMGREASGTAWQPDASRHGGLMSEQPATGC